MNPKIIFTAESQLLVEQEETISLLKFNLSEQPPESGITVSINAPNLSEFNLTNVQVQGGKITLESELEERLQNALDQTRAVEIPGAAVAVVSPFGSWFGASGVADLQDKTPLQASDRFQIGSITKTFVATVIMQLVEEGKLNLGDTLTTWLPESITVDIPNAGKITLKNLLQHTSGIVDYVDVLLNQAATNPGVFLVDWEPEELVDLINGVKPSFAPGESWRYSNTNFILAGLIVEAVTSNNIATEIRNRILNPLNLENTFFAEEEEIPGGYVSGYWDFDRDGTLNNITGAGLSWAWATGAMISNTQDLDTFARSLFKGDLLEAKTLEQMLDTVPTIDNSNYSSYGLGVGTIESANRFWYIHRGETLGYRSNMWYSPQDDLTYIELINGSSSDNLSRDILPPFRAGIADEKFNFTITEQNAQISLPVLNDGKIEGEETATFTVEAGEGYKVDTNANSVTIRIIDAEPVVTPPEDTNNVFYGDGGDDIFKAGGGNNIIYAGEGNNTVITGSGDDITYGGAGKDIINAGSGNNIIYAGEGQNTITTGAGKDLIFAGAAHDIISSGAGDDLIYAGEGKNTIDTGTGLDQVYSGSGADVFKLNKGDGFVTINGLQSVDKFSLGTGLAAGDLKLTVKDGDTIISAGDDQLAVVKWTQLNNLNLA